jgi:hypothetical protein
MNPKTLILAAGLMTVLAGPAQAVDARASDFLGKAPVASASLPNGMQLHFNLDRTRPEPHLLGVRGTTESGDALLAFFGNGRLLSAKIFAGGKQWSGTTASDGTLQWTVPAAAWMPDWIEGGDAVRVSRAAYAAPVNAEFPTAERNANGFFEVDIFAVVTPLVVAQFGGLVGARDEVQRQLFNANTYLANSGVTTKFVLLDMQVYTGTQETAGGFRNLSVLSREPAIREWRNALGADLVLYLRTPEGIADVALGTLFNGSDKNDPPQDVNADRDFFVVSYVGSRDGGPQVADFLTPHELGHTQGGGHNYAAHNQDGLYWQSDAHGFDCGTDGGVGQFASVMSYGNASALNGQPVYGDFYSSPDVVRSGQACGSAKNDGPEVGQADNVRIMNNAAPYVAAYRVRNAAADVSAKSSEAGAGAMGWFALAFGVLGGGRGVLRSLRRIALKLHDAS